MAARLAWWSSMITLAAALAAGPAAAAEPAPRKPCDYFQAFLRFRFGPARAGELLADPVQTRDEKNGFCGAAQSHGGEWVTFVVWNAEGGRRLFGFEDGASEGRPLDTEVTTFWTYEQGAWAERKDAVPALGLADFWDPGKPLPDGWQRQVRISLRLPQRGTAITARLLPAAEAGPGAGELLGQARWRERTLVWDRKAGRFTLAPAR